MSTVWHSRNGLPFPDRVPAAERRAWVRQGHCPDQDLYTLFSRHVRAHPGRQALVDSAGALGYAELDTEVRRVAALYTEAGLGAGDVIAIRLPNGRDAVVAELAALAVGAVALPYPPGGGTRDTLSLLSRSRAAGAVLAEESDLALRPRLPGLRAVFTPGRRPDTRWLGAAAARPWRPSPADPEAPARILVSSGSETEPKMVAYSHNAVAGGRANYVRALHDTTTPPRALVLVPLASSFGSCGVPVTVAALGGTLIVRDTFDPAAALRAVTEHRPTQLYGVPTMLRRMADLPPSPDEDLGSLRSVVSSGAPLPRTTARLCRERFGRPVITVYGSSDGVNCHTAAPGAEPGESAGTPDPAVARIRITAPDGHELPPGRAGEICAKGPMTPLCYVGAPLLDARYRTRTGWVRTGDRGLLDEQGRLHVLGRLRHIVVRGGYNISVAEVEQEIGAHPQIAEVACVPVPDADLGERLCACVREAPGAQPPTLPALTAFLHRERGLERRKLPELLVRVGHMPLGPTGKICRNTLTALAARRHGADHGG